MKVGRLVSKFLFSGAFHALPVLHLNFLPAQYQAPPMQVHLAIAEALQCLKSLR